MQNLEQGSDAWYDQRRGIVTASVVGQLISVGYMGAEAFTCPDCDAEPNRPCRSKVKRGDGYPLLKSSHAARSDVADSSRSDEHRLIKPARNDYSRGLTTLLAAERITGYTEPTYIGADMWRGIEDEPRAVEVYNEHYAPVTTLGFMVRDDWGFRIGYSPDGLVGDDGLVEVKSRRQKKHLATILSGEVPAENIAQLQCGLLVSGRKWIDYISYCGGMPMWVKRVTPDERWFVAILQAVDEFEKSVAGMVADYATATTGLPMTERVVEVEMSL
jgi:hypothetical protein